MYKNDHNTQKLACKTSNFQTSFQHHTANSHASLFIYVIPLHPSLALQKHLSLSIPQHNINTAITIPPAPHNAVVS
ncbi:hypothetical protein RJT34_01008 [Clitoria ternatea]|uniref:Uncharacterized protein n=1 Tax=Clitoria ternatea TaxID=43366 RepID=A0AAN9KJV8_CLITE